MKPITLKQVLDIDGAFSYLELHQGGNVIELRLAGTRFESKQTSCNWDNLKSIIERIKTKAHKEALEATHG